jgi:hypothetical protein
MEIDFIDFMPKRGGQNIVVIKFWEVFLVGLVFYHKNAL